MAAIERQYQKLAQEFLNTELEDIDEPPVKVDGWFGPKSTQAFRTLYSLYFSANRCVAYLIQTTWNKRNSLGEQLEEDGYWGPNTAWRAELLWSQRSGIVLPERPDEAQILAPTARTCTIIKCQTPSTQSFINKYGDVGENQETFKAPYPLRLDWDLSTIVTRITMHESVKDSALVAMQATLDHYGLAELRELGLDRYGGALNVRKMRGGRTWSTHSWGVAIDWFPSANQLRETAKTARFAKPEYAEFVKIWQCAGFMSLGMCYDFDWMHFQKNP